MDSPIFRGVFPKVPILTGLEREGGSALIIHWLNTKHKTQKKQPETDLKINVKKKRPFLLASIDPSQLNVDATTEWGLFNVNCIFFSLCSLEETFIAYVESPKYYIPLVNKVHTMQRGRIGLTKVGSKLIYSRPICVLQPCCIV